MSTQQENRDQKPKTKLNPTDNKLKVSNYKDARSVIFLAKIFLKKFKSVELQALGQATKTVVRVAENLQRSNIVTISKVNSFTETIEGRKCVKLVVTLLLTKEGESRVDQDIHD